MTDIPSCYHFIIAVDNMSRCAVEKSPSVTNDITDDLPDFQDVQLSIAQNIFNSLFR